MAESLSAAALIEAAATGVAVAEVVSQFGKGAAPFTSQMLADMEEHAAKCSVLGLSGFVYDHDHTLLGSPLGECISDGLGSEEEAVPPKTYILYAPPSLGKTTAAVSIFKELLPEEGVKGIMITGRSLKSNYFQHVAKELGVPYSSDWVKCLLAALSPAPGSKTVPVLVLDEFNASGNDDLNIQLMDAFMRMVYGRRLICLVITQDRDVAKKLALLNGYQKIAPLPAALVAYEDGAPGPEFEIPKAGEITHWNWKCFDWRLDELTELAEKRCEQREIVFTPELRARIRVGMTPSEVADLVDAKNRFESPRKTNSNVGV